MNEFSQYRSLLQDRYLIDEMQEMAGKGRLRAVRNREVGSDELVQHLAQQARGITPERVSAPPMAGLAEPTLHPRPVPSSTEAIVLNFGRPSLLIQGSTFEVPESPTWRQTLALNRSRIEQAIIRVGRLELMNHLNMEWVGTAWLIEPNVVITNRHVAEVFAKKGSNGFVFRENFLGKTYGARIDFFEEYEREDVEEIKVSRILYVADSSEPDIALMELKKEVVLPDPIPMSGRQVDDRQIVGVIGYPAYDSRNPEGPMQRYFTGIYDVKRFAPGKISYDAGTEHYFVHDCTTLGGNSGSKVIDLESGEVVGLHFAGRYGEGNFAVKTSFIKDALTRTSVSVPVVEAVEEAVEKDGVHKLSHFTGRDGYVQEFLGSDGYVVPLPSLGVWDEDAAPVAGAPQELPYNLRYRHFSVVLSKTRKLPILTAVNIDGDEALNIRRRKPDKWYVDGRVDNEFQVGNEVYKRNDLDRGHMVRRLDPAWDVKNIARQANDDTFHYTNAVPQHKNLNQKTWLNLEDLVLGYAKAKDLKMSVMTGPVLRPDDREYRGIKLPREFWKIAVYVDEDTEDLTALAFVLSHGRMIRNLEEAIFVPDHLKVYQKTVDHISQITGLGFGPLVKRDPLAARPAMEFVGAINEVLIESGSEIIVGF